MYDNGVGEAVENSAGVRGKRKGVQINQGIVWRRKGRSEGQMSRSGSKAGASIKTGDGKEEAGV